MGDQFTKQASLLTYLGVLPFFMCTAAIIAGFEQDRVSFILRAYGAVIASFISGIHWAIGMKDSQRRTVWLLATSNAVALLAWSSLLTHHAISSLAILALSLILLLAVDSKLYGLRQVDFWFITLRKRATVLVIIALIAAGVTLS